MDLIPYLPKEQKEALLAGPALAPPPGIIANFDSPPTRNDIAHATFVICLFLATFSFIIRMYARLAGLRSVKLEDGLTFIAYWDLHLGDLIEITYVGIQLSFLVASVFALSLACVPYQKIWDFTIPGKCIKKSELEITSAAIHFASDIVILILPQKVIWSLQMSLKKKFGVSIIFSLGVLACLSAILRLISTIEYSTSLDVTYAVSAVILWALAEMTCGFIVLGMPTAPKVLLETRLVSRIKSSFRSWTGTNQSGSKNLSLSQTSKASSTTKSYQKIYDKEIPLQDIKNLDSESTEHLRNFKTRPANAIIRTTHLSTTEDYDYGHRVQHDQLQRQHPWRTKQ
ncbi:hypothetical protein FHL15_005562 [Xylaria flabelliformis]|uniref:Rhodopsin domain-containing protein n=1 Tax=Xylaria flabelliformis TaxID=2512241 RepID=A0A553I057_9PEZI|nr:hypothetical protein FHL15_005562 [Xylaria flabelliformis]